jgi:UPF0042 nucleotide-binding protein
MKAPRKDHARIVVVTGLSGSGKSTVIKVFEDLDYFCVDNLPPVLLPKIVDLVSEARDDAVRIALVADVRGREFLPDFARVIEELRRGRHDVHVLFLDAGDDVLLFRYSETRRKHPLAGKGGAKEAIRRERKMLSPLREMADTVLDSSQYTVHQLRDTIIRRFRAGDASTLRVGIISFGYRYGIPLEADMVVDVRFLPNPNFVPGLKSRTGLDPGVREYVMENPPTREFFEQLSSFLQFLLPLYTKEGKSYFTLGVGCTGGRHRSVVLAEALKRSLTGKVAPTVVHRDIGRASPPARSSR